MPDVVGLTKQTAIRKLKTLHLRSVIRPVPTDQADPGVVVAQSPPAGGKVRPGELVHLGVARPVLTPTVACPSDPLLGVYHPSRLAVLSACQWYVGTVVAIRPEDDGDHHVDITPDAGYGRFLNSGDRENQQGGLLMEIMKGQDLPLPFVGERVSIFGTWVYDTSHGWNEIHPVWAIKYLDTGRLVRKLPPDPPLYNPDAGEDGGAGGGSGGSDGGGGNCTPGYSPCLPEGPSDYDCSGGSGNGPAYTEPGVVYTVTGSDPYGLDADGDGSGCE
jgi:hypothetical protein